MDNLSQDQVIEDIRACIVSSKGGVPITDINRDYKMIVGQSIPYQKLGYQTLESFLKSVPDWNVRTIGGEVLLEAVPTKNTYHLTEMVQGQKSSRSRPRSGPSRSGPRYSRFSGKSTVRPPPRHVQMSNERPRQHATCPGTPPLGSLTRNSRSKVPHPQMLNQKAAVGQNLSGPKRVSALYNQEQPLYLDDQTSCLHQPTSPVGPLSPLSSVLRTPTGVLGPTSPNFDFTLSSCDPRTPTYPIPPLVPVSFTPIPRTNAQARLTRHVSFVPPIERDEDVKVAPNNDFNPFHGNQSNQNLSAQNSNKGDKGGTNYHTALISYCKAKQLPEPFFKKVTRFPKSNAKQLSCSIKIGVDHGFTSYPFDCKTEKEAVEIASKTALEDLQKIYGEVGESLPITYDENLLITRVAEMLDEHPNGLWSLQVPADYRAIHHESLPDGWLDVLRGSPLITIDRAVHDRIILLPNRSGSAKGFSTPVLSSPYGLVDNLNDKMEEMAVKEENRVEVDQNSNGAVTTLGQIRLPEEDYWNVYVSYATSTSNIWIRIIGEEYSALYDEVAGDMELFYMDGGITVENLVVGHFYAIKVDDCWHRVELIELTDEAGENEKPKSATCFFVDNGDDEPCVSSELRVLDASFTKLPCQAVQCHLTGLEDFSSDIVESHLVNSIIGRNFVARPTPESVEDDCSNRPYPSLTLYDTSTDENINLNHVLLENILSDAVPPTLLKNGKIQEAYVSYISKTGALFVQLGSSIYDYMIKAVEEYASNIALDGEDTSGKISSGVKTVFPDVVYLAKYKEGMSWHRAVKDVTYPGVEDGKVWMSFIDYGNLELISLKDMVALQSSSVLSKLPFQAIECRLHNMADDLHFTDKGLRRCREILPSEDRVLLKVVSSITDTATGKTKYDIVEIFKRVQPDNLLASVSTTLSVEEGVIERVMLDALAGGDGNDLRLNKSIKLSKTTWKANSSNETENPRTLSAPKVPKVGELFDVHVTIAANPGNFTVQPWRDAIKFNELMTAMQSVYSSSSKDYSHNGHTPEVIEKYRKPVGKSQIVEGGIYAALHDDQLWYRINVSKVIDAPYPEGGMVSAYFVDYGDVAVMTLDKLRQLLPEFFDVPYQAIKAKLAGVSPVHSDWSVEDCLRFQDMVCNKQFVAKIVETGPDLIDPSDTVIGIHLTDTSDPKVDHSIGQTLIDEGRALAC